MNLRSVTPHRKLGLALAACLMALTFTARTQALAVPHIGSVAIVGTTVTITGQHFGAAPTVKIGESALTIDRSSDTEIVAVTDALSPGVYPLTVSRDGTDEGTARSALVVQ